MYIVSQEKQFLDMYFSRSRGNTDKGSTHGYIQNYYAQEFASKRELPINILEIGLTHGHTGIQAECLGFWKEWFYKGKVFGIDIVPTYYEGTTCITGDAYSQKIINTFDDNFFDYIIDDGPHTLESFMYVIKHWIVKLKAGGKLIIEDIQSTGWLPVLEETARENNLAYKVFDIRNYANRYDDIIFEVTKPIE